jgi:predicted nucleotidyltransferase
MTTEPLASILSRLRAIQPELERQFGVNSLAVFGSYARDEAGPDSDLDLLIDFRPDARPTFFTLARLDAFLSSALGKTVQTVVRDGLNPRLAPYIASELVRA